MAKAATSLSIFPHQTRNLRFDHNIIELIIELGAATAHLYLYFTSTHIGFLGSLCKELESGISHAHNH